MLLLPHTSTQYDRCGKINAKYNAYINQACIIYLALFKIAANNEVIFHTFEMLPFILFYH